MRLVDLEGRAEPATQTQTPAIFGNREQGLDLEIDAPVVQSGLLLASLFQVAGYAMPLARNIRLKEGITFPNGPPYRLHVSVKFPDVKRPAKILLTLSLSPKPGANVIDCRPLYFEVFPSSMTKELTDLLQPNPDGLAPAVVFGPGQKLRHFLTGLHVPFEDGGIDTPDRFDPNRLYFGELSTDEQFQQTQDHSAGARLALFSPEESLPDGVYAERSHSGTLIHVTSPLLDNLGDDPRAQLAFIKIIHLLAPVPPSSN